MSEEEKKRMEDSGEAGAPEEVPSGEWAQFDWKQGVCSWDPAMTEAFFQPPQEGEASVSPSPAPEAALEPEKQPSAPKKKRKKAKGMGLPESILAALVYVAAVLVVSFVLATVGWRWANDLLALDKTELTTVVTITAEQSVGEVAEMLKESGLIEYPFLFRAFAGVTQKGDKITPGTYELNTEMDYSALLNNIGPTSVSREIVTVTIPEGYTAAEIFQLLEDSGVCTAEELEKSAKEDTFDAAVLSTVGREGTARLEGYLFPDTYEFYKDEDAKKVISRMLENFSQRFDEELQSQLPQTGYSMDEIVIIASIIEKETTGTDRRDISSVIYNRLANPDYDELDGHLQMDSTVQYVLPERKEHLTDEDIAIDSPYNTYVVQGLPVGPICNPGLTSLKAALNPNETDYYYFMLGDDGEDHFFHSGEDFNAFKAAQTGEDTSENDNDTEEE